MKRAAFVVMYMVHGERGYDTELVMVRQERDDRATLECPGGRVDAGESAVSGAIREVYEETGIKVPVARLKLVDSKFKHPSSNSLSFCFMVELSPEELETVRERASRGVSNGVEDEEIYLEVVRLMRVMNGDAVIDWSTLGMIFAALNLDE
jgi:8-oxo-dGTP pyrophosphatase MutT (NUDIX family)